MKRTLREKYMDWVIGLDEVEYTVFMLFAMAIGGLTGLLLVRLLMFLMGW